MKVSLPKLWLPKLRIYLDFFGGFYLINLYNIFSMAIVYE